MSGCILVHMAGPADPRLKTYSWTRIRAYWRAPANRRPCARCGGAIDYDVYRIPMGNGRYRINPLGLHVGHIVPRALDRRTTWTVADTQPEHVRCSTSAGTRLGNALRRRKGGALPSSGATPEPFVVDPARLDRSRSW